MIALTWTYFPPTWAMTFAYSFSAPTATIAAAGSEEPDAADAAEQALASSATPSAPATARASPALQHDNHSSSRRSYDGYMIMILNFACNSAGEAGRTARGASQVRRKGGPGCTVRL